MKKRLLTILMAVSLMATALTACGGDDADKEDEKVESVEDDDTEADEAEEAEENEGELEVKTEEPGDDGMIEVEGEVTVIEEDEEEVTPAESEEEEVTPAESEEEDADSVADSEWANAYDDFFSREGILSEKLMISMSMEESGMVFDIAVGVAGEDMFMSYDFGTAGVELYLVDKVLYAGTKMEGVESWIYPGLILAGSVLVLSLIMDKVLKKDTMGGGDIKLLFVIGTFLPLTQCLLMLVIACILGIVMASILLKVDSETAFPFGPALSIAAVITLFVGDPIISWYLSLF